MIFEPPRKDDPEMAIKSIPSPRTCPICNERMEREYIKEAGEIISAEDICHNPGCPFLNKRVKIALDRFFPLNFTEQQIIDLFKFKQFLQDKLGVHYAHSAWDQLQDKDFLSDVITYAQKYWEKSDFCNESISEFDSRLPDDILKRINWKLPICDKCGNVIRRHRKDHPHFSNAQLVSLKAIIENTRARTLQGFCYCCGQTLPVLYITIDSTNKQLRGFCQACVNLIFDYVSDWSNTKGTYLEKIDQLREKIRRERTWEKNV